MKRLQRLEHIVLSLSPSRESTNFSPRILLFVTLPASSVGTSQVIRLIVLIVIYAHVRNLILEINTEDLSYRPLLIFIDLSFR